MIEEKGWMIPTIQFGPDDVFLFEDWDDTPAGPYRAIFHFSPQDFRTLYVNSEEGRDLVSTIHRFDVMHVTDIDSRRQDGRWTIEADTPDRGDLGVEIKYSDNALLKVSNVIASHTPDLIARNSLYLNLLPRLAAPLLGTDPKQKIAGVTEMGKTTRFRMYRIFKIDSAHCSWGGQDLGAPVDCCFQHDMGDYRPVSKAMLSSLSLFVA